MGSGKENSRSTAAPHADGNRIARLESHEGRRGSSTILVQKCSFLEHIMQNHAEMSIGEVGWRQQVNSRTDVLHTKS
jgi:hypothetical protein